MKLAFTVSFQVNTEFKLFYPTCLSLHGFIRGKKAIHYNLLAYYEGTCLQQCQAKSYRQSAKPHNLHCEEISTLQLTTLQASLFLILVKD